MAIKTPVFEKCSRCGKTDGEIRREGPARTGHKCDKPVPGPQPVPYTFQWREAYFVRADGSEVYEYPGEPFEPVPHFEKHGEGFIAHNIGGPALSRDEDREATLKTSFRGPEVATGEINPKQRKWYWARDRAEGQIVGIGMFLPHSSGTPWTFRMVGTEYPVENFDFAEAVVPKSLDRFPW